MRKLKYVLENDMYPDNPRDWDNLGRMICSHRRYDLGDDNDINFSNHNSWSEVFKAIKKEYGNDIVALPLYMYNHGDISISTEPYSCRWDSGQIGFIIAERDDIRKWFNVKRVTAKIIEKARECLLDEVETYRKYLEGEVFAVKIIDENDEVVDSCSGFYSEEEAIQYAEEMMC